MTTPPYPPYPPGPPGWEPGKQPSSTGQVVGLAFAGIGLFIAANLAVTFVVLLLSIDGSTGWLIVGAAGLALFAFGGGISLVLLRRPWAKGLGLGLMIGWALMTVVTAGFCTGVNPALYS
ncbi:hypothetical protein [Aldersonia kunmingensis]|uniref:hypothetical protein n=1 Tax=Aldersonia kunmingensis TaxID=408066 RepID=UPI000A9AE216|nr:hypothetical protein [Aldersonia kunmingensis]